MTLFMSKDCFWERIHERSTREKRFASAGISLTVVGFEKMDSMFILFSISNRKKMQEIIKKKTETDQIDRKFI